PALAPAAEAGARGKPHPRRGQVISCESPWAPPEVEQAPACRKPVTGWLTYLSGRSLTHLQLWSRIRNRPRSFRRFLVPHRKQPQRTSETPAAGRLPNINNADTGMFREP